MKRSEPDLEHDCRVRFAYWCEQYAASVFHADKARYVKKAYEEIDVFLDLRDVQSL